MKNYLEFNEHINLYPIVIISEKIKSAQFKPITDDQIAEELGISKPIIKNLIKPSKPLHFTYSFRKGTSLKIKDGCLPFMVLFWSVFLSVVYGDSFLDGLEVFGISIIIGLIFLLLFSYQWLKFSKDYSSTKIQFSEEEIKRQEKEYQTKLEKYYSEKEKIEAEYKLELYKYKSKIETKRDEITKSIYLKNLEPEIYASRGKLSPRRGIAELKFLEELNNEMKKLIFVDMVPRLNSYGTSNTYNPDFTLICPITNLHIDIEIDEPYSLINKTPIHYEGCGDDERNNFFLELNWCVLRFTEKQIIESTLDCIKTIKSVYENIVNMSIGYDNFLESETKWSYEESLIMQKNGYREKYLNNKKYH